MASLIMLDMCFCNAMSQSKLCMVRCILHGHSMVWIKFLNVPFWGRKEIIWTQSSGVCLAPRRYSSWYYTCWLMQKKVVVNSQGWEWKGPDAFDSRGVQVSFHRVGPEAGPNKPNSSTCLSVKSCRGGRHPTRRTHPMLLLPHPALYCSHQPNPTL